MATPGRRPTDPLIADLADRLGRTDFYQAVRLMLARPRGQAWDLESRVRFVGEWSQAFPGHELSGLDMDAVEPKKPIGAVEPDKPPRCRARTPNYCVAGGLGPLPEAYTDWLREQERSGNPAAMRFLDLFNHRLNALRYRLKESRACGLNNLAPQDSQLGTRLASLVGLTAAAPALPMRSWLGIAGPLGDSRKSPSGLTRALARYLGAPVKLVPLIGAWREIEAEDRIALGRRNHHLGQRSVLGRRVWDQTARIRLVIGPLDHAVFRRLLPPLPGQTADSLFQGLVALTHMLTARRHDCEIRLEVKAETVGKSRLTGLALAAAMEPGRGGQAVADNTSLRLGETAWLDRPRAETAPRADYLIPAFGPVAAP
jgi:type VI secretion system ImpH/TssG family protein